MTTVNIGTQMWATEDLKVTHYRNGEPIRFIENKKKWVKTREGAYCITEAGNYLYNFYAVNDPRGLAPEGFHVPTDGEWEQLVDELGGDKKAGNALKSQEWDGTNISGFSALPGGFRSSSYGYFGDLGDYGYWWSSSPSGSNAWHRLLSSGYSNVFQDYCYVRYGFSVRCIKTQIG
jgi:uncharacterized protein (TIGR02145 family)